MIGSRLTIGKATFREMSRRVKCPPEGSRSNERRTSSRVIGFGLRGDRFFFFTENLLENSVSVTELSGGFKVLWEHHRERGVDALSSRIPARVLEARQ